ncbi:MAG: kelch repeat-containing protein [Polyangiaceae bacterium]|jgi:hypothetical protein
MKRSARVGLAGTIVTVGSGIVALAAASGCSFGSSSPGEKADAALSYDAPTFDGLSPDGGGGGSDGGGPADAGNDLGSAVSPDGGAACTGDGGSGTFTCVGNMVAARVAAGIAPLPGGKALIEGGWNATSTTLTSAEVYDSASGTFTATGSMASPHLWGEWGTTLPVLAGGKVLVAGGLAESGALVSVAEVYDPTAGTFTTTGSMLTPIISMFPLVLGDGSVLFTGGWNSVTGAAPTPGWMFFGTGTPEVERYTPSAGTFADTGPLAENRLAGCNVLLPSGSVLAIGGGQGTTATESNIEQYAPTPGTWTSLGMLTAVPGCTAAYMLPNGKVLMTGDGSAATADLIDPTTLATTPTTGLTAGWVPLYAQLATGDVLAYGGQLNGAYTTQAMVYAAATNTWSAVSPMGQARGGAAMATALADGTVLIVGGTDGISPALATAEVYHP